MHIRWRGLELPGSVEADSKTLTGTYGKFTAEPFERGLRHDRGQQPAADSAVEPRRAVPSRR